eukprot:NODE_1323_length_966_cov_183.198473_g1018_i0.p1 GENE.NODE_1323_length_966_cov_183.198473_g1018_i0~~NODE_1323_length_966_cov_183.198473_g1018_i0.p1  ORF type:complete len:271 (-),score=54.75 NODE_1323_length_966_cov_183.198473_g1018_i0:76-888(-)
MTQWLTRMFSRGALPPPSEACNRLLPLISEKAHSVMDLGCTDVSIFTRLGRDCERAVGVLRIDSADEADAYTLKNMKSKLVDSKLECHVMPTVSTLPDFEEKFDCIISESILGYLPENPPELLQNIFNNLKSGGEFVGELPADGNLEVLRMACYHALQSLGVDPHPFDPFYFPTAKQWKQQLIAAGFTVPTLKPVSFVTTIPVLSVDREDVALIDFFYVGHGAKFANAIPDPDARRRFVAEVVSCCYGRMLKQNRWTHDEMRLQFVAKKP